MLGSESGQVIGLIPTYIGAMRCVGSRSDSGGRVHPYLRREYHRGSTLVGRSATGVHPYTCRGYWAAGMQTGYERRVHPYMCRGIYHEGHDSEKVRVHPYIRRGVFSPGKYEWTWEIGSSLHT